MAAPLVVARVATGLLGEDLGHWAVRLGLLALLAAAVPMALAMLGFAALLGLVNGLSDAPAGGPCAPPSPRARQKMVALGATSLAEVAHIARRPARGSA
jgi:hypothetical protein